MPLKEFIAFSLFYSVEANPEKLFTLSIDGLLIEGKTLVVPPIKFEPGELNRYH